MTGKVYVVVSSDKDKIALFTVHRDALRYAKRVPRAFIVSKIINDVDASALIHSKIIKYTVDTKYGRHIGAVVKEYTTEKPRGISEDGKKIYSFISADKFSDKEAVDFVYQYILNKKILSIKKVPVK